MFVESDGTEKEVMAEIGKNLLDVAHCNNVELEGMYSRLEIVALSSRLIDSGCDSFLLQVLAVASWRVRHVISFLKSRFTIVFLQRRKTKKICWILHLR